MKRMWLAAALILLVLAGALTSLLIAGRFSDTMIASLSEAEGLALSGEYEKAAAAVESIDRQWKKSSPVLSVFIFQKELETMDKLISELSSSLKRRDIDRFCVSCQLCITHMTHIRQSQHCDLHSVL